MKELQKQKFEKSGGNFLKPKTRLAKGTRFVSLLFIAVSILISAGIMQAANVYYDLDTSTIMVNDAQTMSLGLTVSGAAVSLNNNSNFATGINTGTSTGAVTIGGGSGTVEINSSNWDVSTTGAASNIIVNLRAGTATAGTAPLKFISGTNLTTPEAGAVEYNGTNLFFTNSTAERFKVADIDQDLMTTDRLCKYTAAGHLDCTVDSASVGHAALTIADVDSYGANNSTGMALNGQALNLRSADATNPGVITTGTQTIAGAKTFTGSATLASTAAATFTIGNSTGAGTVASGGVSSWTNTAGNLTISTATSGDLALSSAAALNLTSLGAMAFTFDEADGFSLKDDQGTPVTYFEIAADGTLTLRTSADGDEIVLNPEGAGAGIVRVAAGDTLYIGDIPLYATAEGTLAGQANIFGFDYPAQCSTSCDAGAYAVVSRDIIALPNFPAVITGKTRSYKLVVRYADDLTVDGNSTVQIWNTTDNALADSFTIAGTAATGDLDKGKVIMSDDLTIPTDGDDWEVRVGVPAVGDVIRIYSLELAAYDVVD